MKKKDKRTPGVEEARPFSGMSRIHAHAAGVDIGAIEIVACVARFFPKFETLYKR